MQLPVAAGFGSHFWLILPCFAGEVSCAGNPTPWFGALTVSRRAGAAGGGSGQGFSQGSGAVLGAVVTCTLAVRGGALRRVERARRAGRGRRRGGPTAFRGGGNRLLELLKFACNSGPRTGQNVIGHSSHHGKIESCLTLDLRDIV